MLLKAGADVAATHPDGETPLMAASRTGHLDAVKLLIEAGANANAADAYQQETPLMWAAAEGHVDVVNDAAQGGRRSEPQGAHQRHRRAEARRPPDRRLHGADVRRRATATTMS